MKKHLIIIIIAITVQSCSVVSKKNSIEDKITITQNKKVLKVVEGRNILLDRKEFSLQFLIKKNKKLIKQNNFNYARVAFFTNKEAYLNVENNKEGDYHCFTPWMSTATDKNGSYKNVIINKKKYDYKGHIALYYKEKNKKTANLISEHKDYVRLELLMERIEENVIKDTSVSELYVAFYIDKNYDNKIDKGELTKFTLKFR